MLAKVLRMEVESLQIKAVVFFMVVKDYLLKFGEDVITC
jgi:hypothetical protein